MDMPASVEVGPFTYTITQDPAVIDAEAERQGVELFGFTDTVALLIAIEIGQAEDSKRDSLLHECLHAIAAVTGIDKELDAKVVESFVTRMSPLLLGVLRQNPTVVEYLAAE